MVESFHMIRIVMQRQFERLILYHPQTYTEECIYTDVEKQRRSMLSDDDDDGFFEV